MLVVVDVVVVVEIKVVLYVLEIVVGLEVVVHVILDVAVWWWFFISPSRFRIKFLKDIVT